MISKEDDDTRLQQCKSLLQFMNNGDKFLVCAIVANPDTPHDTFQHIKAAKCSDKDLVIILRSLADRVENGTVKLALETKPDGLERFNTNG